MPNQTSPGSSNLETTMPAQVNQSIPVHYVGYTSVGEVQTASVSTLQKPLLHLYSDFLKTGGCTARKGREVVFTDNGLRVCQNSDVTDQFFHYALITYTNTVVLRTFKSHGKKLYGMFEPTSPLSFSTGDRPETLFPLEKRFNKVDNIPTFPLVVMLYRPDPPNNHLHCHVFACLSTDQSNLLFGSIKCRVKSFFEDYETLSVDDNMFSSPVPDFWKLTDDGWRMTMTRKKRRSQQPASDQEDDDEVTDEQVQEQVQELVQELAVFAHSKVMNRRQSSTGDLFVDRAVLASDSGVESPPAERPTSPRGGRELPRFVRGGVRVLPTPAHPPNHVMSSPELGRRGPPVAPKPRNYRMTRKIETGQNPDPATQNIKPVKVQAAEYERKIEIEERPTENRPTENRPIEKRPIVAEPIEDTPTEHRPIEDRPIEEWEWEEVGEQSDQKVGQFSRGKAIRRQSSECLPGPAPSTGPAPFQRCRPVRRQSKEERKKTPFDGPVLLTKSESYVEEEKRKDCVDKKDEIELILADLTYANGIDGMERSASMMNFERSLGYLP